MNIVNRSLLYLSGYAAVVEGHVYIVAIRRGLPPGGLRANYNSGSFNSAEWVSHSPFFSAFCA
jgi:hypothetical protein